MLKMSLPLWMVHGGSDFRGEPFAGEVTSTVNHSQGKSLPQWTIRRGSDSKFCCFTPGLYFNEKKKVGKKFKIHFRGEPFTAEVTSAVNHLQGKWLLRWTIHSRSDFCGEWFTTEVIVHRRSSPIFDFTNFDLLKTENSRKNDLGQLLKSGSKQISLWKVEFLKKKIHFPGEPFAGEVKFLTFESA